VDAPVDRGDRSVIFPEERVGNGDTSRVVHIGIDRIETIAEAAVEPAMIEIIRREIVYIDAEVRIFDLAILHRVGTAVQSYLVPDSAIGRGAGRCKDNWLRRGPHSC